VPRELAPQAISPQLRSADGTEGLSIRAKILIYDRWTSDCRRSEESTLACRTDYLPPPAADQPVN